MSPPKKHIAALDWLRAVFCLAVVLFHTRFALSTQSTIGASLQNLFGQFYVAVDLFFILSGFVVHYVYADRCGAHEGARFVSKRLLRIIPIYWLLTLMAIALDKNHLHALAVRPDFMWNWIIKSLLFVPIAPHEANWGSYPVLLPAWMLPALLYSYLLYGLCMCVQRWQRVFMLLLLTWLGFVALDWLLKGEMILYGAVPSSPFVWEFAFGALIAELYQQSREMQIVHNAKYYLGMFTISVFVFFYGSNGHGLLQSGAKMAALLIGLLLINSRFPLPQIRLITTISESSYVVFLSHIMLWNVWEQWFAWHAQIFILQAIEYICLLIFIVILNDLLFKKMELSLANRLEKKFNL